jgi:hypothetical protein
MNAITILDIALGLALVYLAFSIVCSTSLEWVSAVFARRAKMLKAGIEQLLGGAGAPLAAGFHAHPMIAGLKKTNGYPNYISSSTFARVLTSLALDIKRNGGLVTLAAKPGLKPAEKTLVESLVAGAETVAEAERRIEQWFTGGMERVSGWYKRWTQLYTIAAALVVVGTCNVDTIQIARELNRNAALRTAMAERAVRVANSGTVEEAKKELKEIDLPFAEREEGPWSLEHLLGLTLSVFAISLGAPFWFDLLNRLVNLRQTGVKPATPQAVAH